MKVFFKRGTIAALLAISMMMLASCVIPGGKSTKPKTTLAKVPSTISVPVPRSLTTATAVTALRGLRSARSLGARGLLGSTDGYDATTGAYAQIQGAVQTLKAQVAKIAIYMSYVDAVLAQNNLPTSPSPVANATVTIGQETLDNIYLLIPDAFDSDVSEVVNTFDFHSVPPFIYDIFSRTPTDPYDFYFQINLDPANADPKANTMTLYWSADRAKVKISNDSKWVDGDKSFTQAYFLAYDDAKKVMTTMSDYKEWVTATPSTVLEHSTTKVSLGLRTDSTTAAVQNGVFVFFDESSESRSADPTALPIKSSYSAEGVADNAGGYLSSIFSEAPDPSKPLQKDVFRNREYFNGLGAVVKAEWNFNNDKDSQGNLIWTTDSYFSDSSLDGYRTLDFESTSTQAALVSSQSDVNSADDSVVAEIETDGSQYYEEALPSAVGEYYLVSKLAFPASLDGADLYNLSGADKTFLDTNQVGTASCDSAGTVSVYFDDEQKKGAGTFYLCKLTISDNGTATTGIITLLPSTTSTTPSSFAI